MQLHAIVLVVVATGLGLLAVTVWLALAARGRERARAASEAELQEVLDHAVDAIEINAPDGQLLYVNHAWRTLFGYGRDEWIPSGSEAMVIPAQADTYRAMRRQLLHGGDAAGATPSAGETFEGVFVTRDGSRIVVSVRANAKREHGTARAVRSILRDVTAHCQVEESQARLVSTFEATTDFVALTTRTGRTEYLNRAGRRMMGLGESDDLSAIDLSEFFTPDARQHFSEFALPSAIRDGTWEGESTVRSGDGREIPVSVVIVAHESARGGVWFLSTILRDITAQRRRERELLVLIETAQAMSEALDVVNACRIAVERLCAATGWPYAEAWMPTDSASLMDRVAVWHREDTALAQFAASMGAFRFARGEGIPGRVWDTRRPFWMRDLSEVAEEPGLPRQALMEAIGLRAAVGIPVIAGGEVVAALGFHMLRLTDDDAFLIRLVAVVAAQLGMIIVRKRAEQALHERDINEWKRLDRMKSEFVSTVSHELRTPLTAIRGALGLLDGGVAGPLAPQVTDLVRVAVANSDRLIRLINDLLDLDKIAAGKLELRLESLIAADVVRAAVDGIHALTRQYDISLVERVTAAGTFSGDRDRMIQVLTNLLSNAIKFSPAGSTVVITAVDQAAASKPLAAGPGATGARAPVLRFRVENPGRGITAPDIARLFRRFQQLDSSDTRTRGGTGLGLAISKSIVEQHGGTIGVESEPGVKTVFWFELPALAFAPCTPLPPSP